MTGWVGVDHLLTPQQAAAALSVSVWTIASLRRAGRLRAVRVGGSYRYDPADLRTFITENRTTT